LRQNQKITIEPIADCQESNFGSSKLCLYSNISTILNYWGRQAMNELDAKLPADDIKKHKEFNFSRSVLSVASVP